MKKRITIRICLGSACYSRGALDILESLKKHIAENEIAADVEIIGSLCEDNCRKGPVVEIAGVRHFGIDARKTIHLLENNLNGRIHA